jgi:foldase protein PrsA
VTVAPIPSSAPASAPSGDGAVIPADDVLAYVEGTPITRSFAGEELIRTHGLSLMQQMVLLIAARHRAQQLGLKVTPADIQAAHDDALKRIATPIGSGDLPLDRTTAERLLNEFLLAKNIARSEWDRRMEQRAYMRKIAEAEVDGSTLTDQMLREEHALQHGERVQVRHIQVASLEAESRVRQELAAGKDFELVARQMSENQVTAARGGLMAPFSENDPSVTPLIRQAAFQLKAGELSPAVHENDWYHILRLERRIPASGEGYENADKTELRARLRQRLVSARMNELETELFNKAKVEIRDRDLRRQFEQQRR